MNRKKKKRCQIKTKLTGILKPLSPVKVGARNPISQRLKQGWAEIFLSVTEEITLLWHRNSLFTGLSCPVSSLRNL